MNEILDELTPILREVFDNDSLVATPGLTAPMVEGWDSLNNVRLFVAIEQALNLRFTAQEIAGLENVGELAELIQRKRDR